MRILLVVVAVLAVTAVLAAAFQTHRYLRIRRDVVHDRQPLLYDAATFHVATIAALAPDQELLASVGELVHASEATGGTVVYAGKVAVNAMASDQLPPHSWDAVVLAQYPSRDAYELAAANPRLIATRAGFAASYAIGFQRPAGLNLGIPIALLAIRVRDAVLGREAPFPFVPADTSDAPPEQLAARGKLVEGLLANTRYGREAVVVVNFTRDGDPTQREANAGYGAAMLRLMADQVHGPMHVGRAVRLEGDAEFDNVIFVYYPGVQYFADMVRSRYFGGIVGGKQLADTLASPTVPLLPHLESTEPTPRG